MILPQAGCHSRPPDHPMRRAVCSLFWIIWVETHRPYHPNCKSVEDCHHLGTPNLQPVSNISCYMELQLGDGTSSHFKSCCIFVLQNISLKFPYGTPYPDQSNLACLEQTPIFHCSKVEAHRCCLSETNWTPVYQHLGFQNLKPTVNS